MKPLCFTLLFATLILSGCSPAWHIRQAIRKNPQLLKLQTILVTDTIVLPSVELRDTVTLKEVDTITLVKDRFRVKIMRSYDTLIIDGGCDADTIVRTVSVPFEKIVYQERDKWYHKLYFGSFLLLILMFFLGLFKRLFKHS